MLRGHFAPPPQTQAPPKCLAIRQEVYFTPPDLDSEHLRHKTADCCVDCSFGPFTLRQSLDLSPLLYQVSVGVILHAPNERKKKKIEKLRNFRF